MFSILYFICFKKYHLKHQDESLTFSLFIQLFCHQRANFRRSNLIKYSVIKKNRFGWSLFLRLLFFKYFLLIMLLQFSQLFPLHPASPTLQHSPPPLVHVHGLYRSIIWVLCFLYNFFYLSLSILCLLIMILPCMFPPYSSFPPPHWNPSMWCPFLLFCSCSSCLLSFCFHCFSFPVVSFVDSSEFVVILLFIFLIFFFLDKSLNVSYNKGLVMMNSFNLTLSGKHFICPSSVNDSFAG